MKPEEMQKKPYHILIYMLTQLLLLIYTLTKFVAEAQVGL